MYVVPRRTSGSILRRLTVFKKGTRSGREIQQISCGLQTTVSVAGEPKVRAVHPAPLLQGSTAAGAEAHHRSPARRFSTGGKKVIPFVLADIGEGIAEVELLQWFVSEGEAVQQFDNICEVQSDKATVEISSRYEGVVKSIHFKVGDMVQVGSALVDIEVEADDGDGDSEQADEANELEAAAAQKAASHSPSTQPTAADAYSTAPPLASDREILTTPAVRKIAKENAVDLAAVPGSGPNGRILKEDILAFIAGGSITNTTPSTSENAAKAIETSPETSMPAPSKALPSRGAVASGTSRSEQISGMATVSPPSCA